MTKQDNINKRTTCNIKQKTFNYITATTILISLIGVITSMDQHSINGQTMIGNSTVNSSLSQAITTAERSLGNNSYAIGAFGEDHDGSLVYRIILSTSGTEFYDAAVDSANGQILTTLELSQKELEDKHLGHSQKMLTQPKLNNTFDTFAH